MTRSRAEATSRSPEGPGLRRRFYMASSWAMDERPGAEWVPSPMALRGPFSEDSAVVAVARHINDEDPGALRGRRRPLTAVGPRTVSVFQEAPDVLEAVGVSAGELDDVRVPLLEVERGLWQPPVPRPGVQAHFGLLLLGGLILRRLTLNGRTGAELLGAGDLLQPWVRQPPYDLLTAEPGWEVVEDARLAVLDARFAAEVAPWPGVAAALVGRAIERSRRLAFHHVASHIPGLHGRLLALFWAHADRWGRVTSEGVLVPLVLTHATIAELVGASRPSVSTALAELARRRAVRRVSAGWLLDAGFTQSLERRAASLGPAN